MGLIVNVLHVAGRAVRFATLSTVTRSARMSRRCAIDRIEREMATVARETPFGVAFDSRHNLHPLIVQRMKLITPPLLL